MNFLLLTGAGFSRNWGGWLATEVFEYLLGCPEIRNNEQLRQILWRHQPTGGFESALAEVQKKYLRDPAANLRQLNDIQAAISSMFVDMNQAYFETHNFEFQNHQDRMIRTFMARFDAIFTLNQDLLLEHYYLNDNVALTLPQRWDGVQLPGMQPHANLQTAALGGWAQCEWSPITSGDFIVDPRLQPTFKLHGSSNWHHYISGPLLVMGANKAHDIEFHPILSWYFQQFEERLTAPDTRLMIIGYGFRDAHINQIIIKAINEHDLQIFVVDPAGAQLAASVNPAQGGTVRGPATALEEAFAKGLIGASRRQLSNIFGSDSVEHNKVQRFFAP